MDSSGVREKLKKAVPRAVVLSHLLDQLREILNHGNIDVIEKEEVDRILNVLEIDVRLLLSLLVVLAAERAIIPVSNFHVGCSAIGESGNIYTGTNIEFYGFSLGYSIHAEQCLISNALANNEKALKILRVNHPPCGHCRQFIRETNK